MSGGSKAPTLNSSDSKPVGNAEELASANADELSKAPDKVDDEKDDMKALCDELKTLDTNERNFLELVQIIEEVEEQTLADLMSYSQNDLEEILRDINEDSSNDHKIKTARRKEFAKAVHQMSTHKQNEEEKEKDTTDSSKTATTLSSIGVKGTTKTSTGNTMKIMFIGQEEEQAIERIQFGQQYMNETVDKIKQLLNNKQNNKKKLEQKLKKVCSELKDKINEKKNEMLALIDYIHKYNKNGWNTQNETVKESADEVQKFYKDYEGFFSDEKLTKSDRKDKLIAIKQNIENKVNILKQYVNAGYKMDIELVKPIQQEFLNGCINVSGIDFVLPAIKRPNVIGDIIKWEPPRVHDDIINMFTPEEKKDEENDDDDEPKVDEDEKDNNKTDEEKKEEEKKEEEKKTEEEKKKEEEEKKKQEEEKKIQEEKDKMKVINIEYQILYRLQKIELKQEEESKEEKKDSDEKEDKKDDDDEEKDMDIEIEKLYEWNEINKVLNVTEYDMTNYVKNRPYEARVLYIINNVLRSPESEITNVGYIAKWSVKYKGEKITLSDNNNKALMANGDQQTVRAQYPIVKGMIVKLNYIWYCASSIAYEMIGVVSSEYSGDYTKVKTPYTDTTLQKFTYGIRGAGGNSNYYAANKDTGFECDIGKGKEVKIEMVIDYKTYDTCCLSFYKDGALKKKNNDDKYSMKLPELKNNHVWFPAVALHYQNNWCKIQNVYD